MTNRKYYKVTTSKGIVTRSTDKYFLAAVVVDSGAAVYFCRDFRRADSVHSREMTFSRDVVTINLPTQITKEEYDAIRLSNKVGA